MTADADAQSDIIEFWIASNVYGKEGLDTELESVSTIRITTAMVELASAISSGEPPARLVERLGEIAGVDPDSCTFDELLDLAREKATDSPFS